MTVRPGDERHAGSIVVDAGEDALVRLFADASVPAGETLPGDVVAVFGSADIAGTVEGDVVAVLGSVRLHPGARVEGDAVAIGGGLDQPAGAEVGGQSIAIGGIRPAGAMPTAEPSCSLFVLAGWLATLLLAWLLVPALLRAHAAHRERRVAPQRRLVLPRLHRGAVPAAGDRASCVLVTAVVGIPLAVPVLLFVCCCPGPARWRAPTCWAASSCAAARARAG